MTARLRSTLTLVLVAPMLALPTLAHACYWDSDTLSMEKRRFPGVVELLHGRVLRRSKPLYTWRVTEYGKRLKANRDDLALYDQLAVALDKLGQHAEAIAVQKGALKKAPKRYESHANLGTFYLHAGQLDEGIRHIEQAIAINPAAHFGREVVQLELARYLKANAAKGKTLPTLPVAHDMYGPDSDGADALVNKMLDGEAAVMRETIEPKKPWLDRLPKAVGFAAWLEKKNPKLLTGGLAAKGLSGMLYFGNPDSPYLLEALADVLRYDAKMKSGSTQLAALAYLKAGVNLTDSYQRVSYYAKAGRALAGIRGATIQKYLDKLLAGMKRGAKAEAAVTVAEKRWIAKGKNPDVEFAKTYYKAGGKELETLVAFAVGDCESGPWGNLRKRSQVPRKEMLALTPRASWHGMTFAGLITTHGAPICHFRGQWLFPLRSTQSGPRRGVWLKASTKAKSSVVRLLEPPAPK